MSKSTVGLGHHGENLSIMIPTYNCANYLIKTLESLKSQGSILDNAQIEVVDDHSLKDDPQSVVQKIWGNKVRFFRQPKNCGLVQNFNTCIDRAERKWIHILHGDDFVLPGAYEEFAKCIEMYPEAKAVFARSVFVDKDDLWTVVTQKLGDSKRDILEYHPNLWTYCPVQFAGILISKNAIETVGMFNHEFCHAADWNLWWRIAKSSEVVYSNICIGAYRVFEGNHTSKMKREAKNIKEYLSQISLLVKATQQDSADPHDTLTLYEAIYHSALSQCENYIGDSAAFHAHLRVMNQFPPAIKNQKTLVKLRLRHIKRVVTRLKNKRN